MNGHPLRAALTLVAMTAVIAGPLSQASAQAIERHTAPGPQAPAEAPIASPEPQADQDARPLGADLTAVILLGADDPATSGASVGAVDARRIAAPDPARLDRSLARFIGRPLSRRLISQVEAAIVEHYRRSGRPFVAVKPPPQDITKGELRLRVIEFRLGKKAASGASAGVDKTIEAGVRLKSGDLIEAARLQQDLEWLNHSPFRTVTAMFTPGQSLGATDLRLQAQNAKPWQVFAGYANSGTPSSGLDRWFLGAQVGDLFTPGSLLAYQMTASDDFWYGHHTIFGAAANPQYVGHSLVTVMPVAPRQDFTLVANYIDSTTMASAFQVRSHTGEVSLVYRTALSNLVALPGDLSLGLEARGQRTDTYFGTVRVVGRDVAVGQAVVGWSGGWAGMTSHQTLSVTAHISPGGLGADNQGAAFFEFSNGRVRRSDYAYADIDYRGDFQIVGAWRFATTLDIQVADRPLIDTEQLAIGGDLGVRGYVYDDGSFDSGAVWRNELRMPLVSLWGGRSNGIIASPFLFADVGYGQDLNGGPHQFASATGAGLDARLGAHLTAGMTGGWTLQRAAYTPAGDFKVLANARLTF